MKTKEKSDIKFRIILLPDERLSSIAVLLAKQYAKYGKTHFVIDGNKFLPHVTVYYGKFPITAKQKVFKVVESVSKKYSQVDLEYGEIENFEDWVMIDFKLKGFLKHIHSELLKKLSTLGEVHPFSTSENYQPHITLLRYKKQILYSEAFSKIKIDEADFNSKCIYLAIAGAEENGVVSKIIKKFKLN